MVPGLVTTSMARKWPSFGASPMPASIEIATRLVEMVEGTGVLIGPACCGGAAE